MQLLMLSPALVELYILKNNHSLLMVVLTPLLNEEFLL